MTTPSPLWSLAWLTASDASVLQALDRAAATGYDAVGLRLWPNAPGAPHQPLLGHAPLLRECVARVRDTGVGVFDIEITRIGPTFNPAPHQPLFEAAQALGARALLVAADDTDRPRLVDAYAALCEAVRPWGLTANLEFMPWTAVKTVREARTVIEAAGSPANAGLLVDALHFGRSASTAADVAALPRAWLHYAQLCDAQAGLGFTEAELIHTAREDRLLPGEGTIDLAHLLRALPTELPLSVEIPSPRRARLGPDRWAHVALQACQACWRSARS